MKIAIGSDKSGFSAKEAIKAYLTETGADMSVVSNKHRGCYAVACEGVYSAKMARAIK